MFFAHRGLLYLNIHKSNVEKLEQSNWRIKEEIMYMFQLDTKFFCLFISVTPVYLPSVKFNEIFELLEKKF